MAIRDNFPIFANNPELIYLDSAATSQKPSYVIDGISAYLQNDYANIHRGRYSLSARSEELYHQTREHIASFINATPKEVIFTNNSTFASNLLVSSLVRSGMIQPGDRIVLSPLEHHATIVPWMMAAEQVGCTIDWLPLSEGSSLDIERSQRVVQGAKLVAVSYVSNVTGEIVDLTSIKQILPTDCLLAVDASQAAPHIPIDVKKLGCDFLWFTGHKMMASTGVGVLYGRAELLQRMQPSRGGGSAISEVTSEGYTLLDAPDKFEPGTPNLVGVVSLLKALEYIETLGGTVVIGQIEQKTKQFMHNGLSRLHQAEKITLIGPRNIEKKIGLYSFLLPDQYNPHQLGEWMADRNICIRCGGLCAQPLHQLFGKQASCRVSLYLYNTLDDVEIFLTHLHRYLA